MITATSIYNEAVKIMSPEQIDGHESDLYLMVTPESKKLVADYEYKFSVKTFVSAIAPHVLWYDIPFAYAPYWDRIKLCTRKPVVHFPNKRKQEV